MNYVTHNQERIIGIGGTSFQGYVDIPYGILVRIFGEPMEGDMYKTQAEWEVCFEDGTVATIYDYKVGACYCGEDDGIAKEDVTDWHIGGHNEKAVDHVLWAVDAYLNQKYGD
jgi:hypothetical protein